jgi:hypothetical protein
MLGLLPLAGLLFLSNPFGAYAIVVAEGRVGQAPIQAGQNPEATVVGVIVPIGALEYERPDRQVILDYGPRILWRRPNALGSNKALVLHVANLSVTVDATKNVRLIERGSASYGQADYLALSQLGLTQGTLPPVLDIFAASAGTGLRWDANRIWRTETMFEADYRRTLGQTEMAAAANPTISFRQTNLELDSSAIARLSRRNDLVLTAGISDRMLDNGIDIFAATPQVGWRSRLSWSSELRLAGGVTYVRDRGSTPLVGAAGIARPVGSAELSGLLLGRRGASLRGSAGATIDYFVDPFLRAAGPRGSLVARSQLLLEPDWTIGLEASFASSLRGTSLPGNPPPDETVAAVSLPIRHLIPEHVIVETGLRWSVRAPRIRADNLVFHERQTWIYLALTVNTRRGERWVAPREPAGDARDEGAFARSQTTEVSRQSADTVEPTEPVSAPLSAPPSPANGIQPAGRASPD